ncbi:XdhC family protein [Aquipuribacter sp. MA13-6]|uniref:XdhC family protein n=1 Tax=unclassified Aquipuribacter TaxID=2635084 RepID=UPI003EEAF3EF
MGTPRLDERIEDLLRRRVPFVQATVVRAEHPTSASPGDTAVVLADGSLEGFVGGDCARTSVRTAALQALDSGESVLLRILPDTTAAFPDVPGAVVAVNECLSGGALEIFLHARVPAPVVHVVGDTENARAITAVAESAGLAVRTGPVVDLVPGTVAVVEASHGDDETTSLRAALDAGIGFVGMIASERRGAAVLDGMGLDASERARVHSPVGLPIGSVTPGEIGLSVVAQVVRALRTEGLTAPAGLGAVAVTVRVEVDPVCGMDVVVDADALRGVREEQEWFFCGAGCRESYLAGVG